MIATVESVSRRETSKGPIWDIVFGDGTKASTWSDSIGQQAFNNVGQQASVGLITKPSKNPDYPPNTYLESIQPVQGFPLPAQSTAPTLVQTTASTASLEKALRDLEGAVRGLTLTIATKGMLTEVAGDSIDKDIPF